MLRNVLKLGSVLKKHEQKLIAGGNNMEECSLGDRCSIGSQFPSDCLPDVDFCCVNGFYEICGQ
ncbi:hypothetical protein ABMY20_13210 [Tenacibaculum sp. SSH1-16]|uniref:hypothetical protein n=1 Tax=Tenacibaculum sp. SSH1-16 TaxID=3136667 RepID=UPI0032C3E4D4